MDALLLISGAVFLLVVLVSWGAFAYFRSKQEISDWRVRAKGQSLSKHVGKKDERSKGLKENFVKVL